MQQKEEPRAEVPAKYNFTVTNLASIFSDIWHRVKLEAPQMKPYDYEAIKCGLCAHVTRGREERWCLGHPILRFKIPRQMS